MLLQSYIYMVVILLVIAQLHEEVQFTIMDIQQQKHIFMEVYFREILPVGSHMQEAAQFGILL